MIKKIIESDKHKPSSPSQAKDAASVSVDFKHKHYHVAEAAVGEKNNDDVTLCNICASNGWPREPIKWSRNYGRVLSDGTREILGYKPINYVKDTPHQIAEGHFKRRDVEAA